MKLLHRLASAVVVACLVAAESSAVWAGQITWGLPQQISGDSDVLTTGSLVYAYNFGLSLSNPGDVTSTTVNGVLFQPFASNNTDQQSLVVGNLSLAESPDFLYGGNYFGSGSAPYSSLSSAYKELLNNAIYAAQPGTITVTLGGLTNGQNYSVQWWTNDSSKTYQSLTTASGVANVTLDPNTTDLTGGLGQYAIGTFTAAGTSQTFTLTGSQGPDVNFNFPMISGLQLRTAGASPVPEIEPTCLGSVLALLGGGLGLLERRRKRA